MTLRVDRRENTRVLNIANGATLTTEEIPVNNVVGLSIIVPTGLSGPLFIVAQDDQSPATYDPVLYQGSFMVFNNTAVAVAKRRWIVDIPFQYIGTPLKLLVGTTTTDPTPLAGGQVGALTLSLYLTRQQG